MQHFENVGVWQRYIDDVRPVDGDLKMVERTQFLTCYNYEYISALDNRIDL